MKTSYTFTAPIPPRVKGRPRLARNGKTYTPKATREFEEALGAHYQGPMFDGPVALTVRLYPKCVKVTVRQLADELASPLRGDIDNYVKAVCDGLNKVAYGDDGQIVQLNSYKLK